MPFMRQLPQAGFCSPHLIFLLLQLKHPPRDFVWERRVRFGARVRVLRRLIFEFESWLPLMLRLLSGVDVLSDREERSHTASDVRSGDSSPVIMSNVLSSKVMF